jgi:hypothetical protein
VCVCVCLIHTCEGVGVFSKSEGVGVFRIFLVQMVYNAKRVMYVPPRGGVSTRGIEPLQKECESRLPSSLSTRGIEPAHFHRIAPEATALDRSAKWTESVVCPTRAKSGHFVVQVPHSLPIFTKMQSTG